MICFLLFCWLLALLCASRADHRCCCHRYEPQPRLPVQIPAQPEENVTLVKCISRLLLPLGCVWLVFSVEQFIGGDSNEPWHYPRLFACPYHPRIYLAIALVCFAVSLGLWIWDARRRRCNPTVTLNG